MVEMIATPTRDDLTVEWQSDRDIPDHIWNRYLKKYGKRYRLVKDKINIWYLGCKFGTIQLHSLLKHQLCFVGDFRSIRHKTWFKKSLVKMPFKAKITQDGDTCIVFVFDEKFLDSLANTLRVYKKKKISDEYRRVLIEQMKKAREFRKSTAERI